MSQSSYRGVVINGTVVFSNGSRPLIDGTDVIVTPTSPQRGSASALCALSNRPHRCLENGSMNSNR